MNRPDQTSPVLRFLLGEKWALFVFVCITIPLMVHTAHLIIIASGIHFGLFPGDEILYSIFFAVGFDMAILTLAVRGRGTDFTLITFLIFLFNAFFLNIHYIEALQDPYPGIAMLVIRLVIAAAATWLVHAYVTFYVQSSSDKKDKWDLYQQIEALSKNNKDLEQALRNEKSISENLKIEKATIEAKYAVSSQTVQEQREDWEATLQIDQFQFTCVCGKKPKTEKAMQRHLEECSVAKHANILSVADLLNYMHPDKSHRGQDRLLVS